MASPWGGQLRNCGSIPGWRKGLLTSPECPGWLCGPGRGGQKFLELLQKIYLKYLYKFETLVYFTVLPLWLGGPVLALHSLLETLSKLFDGNAVKGRQWFSLNLCNVRKMPPFKIMLHLWVQKKVIRREVRRVGGGGTQPPFRFYQKTAGRSKAVWTGALSWCMNQSPL